MRFARALLGGLLWLLASLVGLVGIIACVTLILLPIGIPLLGLARRLFGKSVRLFLPPALAHPTKEPKRRGRKARKAAGKLGEKSRRTIREKVPAIDLDPAAKKTRRFIKQQRKRLH